MSIYFEDNIEKILAAPTSASRDILRNYYNYKTSINPDWKFSDKTINFLFQTGFSRDTVKYAFERSTIYTGDPVGEKI